MELNIFKSLYVEKMILKKANSKLNLIHIAKEQQNMQFLLCR